MSRINFDACKTVGDIERLHGEVLVGKMLFEWDMTETKWVNNEPYNEVRKMLIFGLRAIGKHIEFDTEEMVGQREQIAFHAGLQVVTNIVEMGDVFWSPDDYKKTNYTIDDLSEDDYDFDGFLRTANDFPTFVDLSELTRISS